MNEDQINQILVRLDRLESKEAIREIVSSYAIACDEHDLDRLMNLFTEDACFDAPNGAMVANGKQDIERMFINTFRARGPGYHWTHDVVIHIDPEDSDRATGLVLSHAETTPNGVVSMAAMRYADEYCRGPDGQWRFDSREITFFYYVPATEYATSLTQSNRVLIGDQHHAADYPEHLPIWHDFVSRYGSDGNHE